MSSSPNPTEAELQLLRVLWARGPSTVRQVHTALSGNTTRYTTTLKLLQNMHGKGFVTRDESVRVHVYHPAVHAEPTLSAILGDLADRLFDGSAAMMALHALRGRRSTPEELASLRRMVEKLEKEK